MTHPSHFSVITHRRLSLSDLFLFSGNRGTGIEETTAPSGDLAASAEPRRAAIRIRDAPRVLPSPDAERNESSAVAARHKTDVRLPATRGQIARQSIQSEDRTN